MVTTIIDDFRSVEYRYLSNFYLAPVEHEGIIYPSVEHAYQAAKTLDPREREEFLYLTAAAAKKYGRKVAIRPDWGLMRLELMRALVRKKFEVHAHLRAKLMSTGGAQLVEKNWWHDNFWGVCTCLRCPGEGLNNLGDILMKLRADLSLYDSDLRLEE